jgi:hypothetical protein
MEAGENGVEVSGEILTADYLSGETALRKPSRCHAVRGCGEIRVGGSIHIAFRRQPITTTEDHRQNTGKVIPHVPAHRHLIHQESCWEAQHHATPKRTTARRRVR